MKHCYRFPIQRVNFIKLYVSLFVDSNKSYAYEKPRSRCRTIFFLSSKSDNIFMRYTLFCCGRQRKAVPLSPFSVLSTKVHYRLKKMPKLFFRDRLTVVPLTKRCFNSNVEYEVKLNLIDEEKRRQLRS